MTRRPRKPTIQQAAAHPPVAPPAPFGFGVQLIPIPQQTQDRKIIKSEIPDCSIELDDGTTIFISATIHDVKQVVGAVGPSGEPVYNLQLSWKFKTIPAAVKSAKAPKAPKAKSRKAT